MRVEKIPLSSSSSSTSSDKPSEDVSEKQPIPNSDMAVSERCLTGAAGVAKDNPLQSALPQRSSIDQDNKNPVSAPSFHCLPNSGPSSEVKIESRSSSLSISQSLSDSDRKENEASPPLKSILILSSEMNSVQPRSTGRPSKSSKKVTMSNDVQIINGQIDEVSCCSSSILDEECTKKKFETAGTKQIKGGQTQSRVVSVSSEGELISKDNCKTQ